MGIDKRILRQPTFLENNNKQQKRRGYTLLVRAQLTKKNKRRREEPGAHLRVPWKWCVFVDVAWRGV